MEGYSKIADVIKNVKVMNKKKNDSGLKKTKETRQLDAINHH